MMMMNMFRVHNKTLINARVNQWMSSRKNTQEEELLLRNDFEEEIDVDFNT